MRSQTSAAAYHQARALGATPLGQVIALYDTILRDLRQAVVALDAGQVEQRVNSTNHALIVIGELQGVLDFERGGESARHLNSFYNVARAMATEASIANSREKFQELISMIARLRAAWSKISPTVTATETPEISRSAPKPGTDFARTALPTPDGSASVSTGKWEA
ncbi:MAG TPA: flagellar export chaperone FliS [Candidatus Solibacter sp.]|nr:flagellar export chaperone FliS [Candidatus Solibacter sp.]